jgi:hypothetical protein
MLDPQKMVVVNGVGDITNIIKSGWISGSWKNFNYISNAYLKYIGVTTVSLTNGRTRELATFNLIYNF